LREGKLKLSLYHVGADPLSFDSQSLKTSSELALF